MPRFHPGLRQNRHMLRMIKDGGQSRRAYRLGSAYGNEISAADDTERRRRILDQWGMQSQSIRKPEPDSIAQPLQRRAQAAYFYQVPDGEQHRLVKRQHNAPLTRRDVLPGTKDRIHLGRNHADLIVESYPTYHESPITASDSGPIHSNSHPSRSR